MSFPLKVTLSVNGRFHAFDFAQELNRADSLHQLITPYPAWFLRKWNLPAGLLTPLARIEIARRLRERLARVLPLKNGQLLFNDWFDRLAAESLWEGADFFVGWSGNSLHTLNRARALGQKTVLERHSAHIDVQQELLTEEFQRFGLAFESTHPGMIEKEKEEYDSAQWISLPSRFAKKTFLDKGFPESRLLHHPLAVDLRAFSSVVQAKPSFRVLFAGNIALQKGVPYLLDGFSSWKNSLAQCHLMGSTSREMTALLPRWTDERIRIFAPQKGEHFSQALREATIVCLPSIQDGFNQVAVQAMACGVPVICSTNTGTEELIEPGVTGFVVPIRDSRAIAERLAWAFEHPDEIRQMGVNARKRVEKNLSWKNYSGRRLEEFSRLKNEREISGQLRR